MASLPAVSESRSHVSIGGSTGMGRVDRVTAYDDADAWAKITHPGVERTYARVGGRTPQGGPSNNIRATALAASETKWMAVGPVGQMVSIDLNYFIDGWLFAGRAGEPTSNLSSHLNIVMRINRGNDWETMLFARGVLWHSSGLNSSFQAMNGWPDSQWNSSWTDTSSTLTSRVGSDLMYDVNYGELIPGMFQVMSNTPFALSYSVSLAAINSVGPVNAFATADFSNTAGMGFSTTTPGFTVQEIISVPEPTAMFVFGLATFALRRSKRG